MLAAGDEFEVAPRFSPDGKRVAYAVGERTSRIVVEDLATRTRRLVGLEGGIATSPVFFPDGKRIAYLRDADGTCALIEVALTFRTSKAFVWPASAMLTGSGVALILRVVGTPPDQPWNTDGMWIFAGVAAFSLEQDDGEALVVVQEVEAAYVRDLDADAVIGTIRQAVAEEHDVAAAAVVLIRPGSIPKTSSGKIRRRATSEAYLAGTLPVVATWTRPASSGPATTSVFWLGQTTSTLSAATADPRPKCTSGGPCER